VARVKNARKSGKNVILKDKRIVVTGGHGFLGKVVCRKLKSTEAIVIPLSRSSEGYDFTNLKDVKDMYNLVKPDIVIHLAAEVGGIGANQRNPGRFFFANLQMGMHLIEEGRKHGLDKFVQIGTVCSYPKETPVPFDEYDLWNGYPERTNAPYGIAKKALLTMLQSYREQYNFNGIYLIPSNLYGPGDNFDLETCHVIPALIKKMVYAKEFNHAVVDVWGNGSATREFLYVDDCANAIVKATKSFDGYGGFPINIGTGKEINITNVVKKIKELVGYKGDIIWDTIKPNGQMRRCLNVEKAEDYFRFKAQTDLDTGLKYTVDWYEKHR